MKRAIPVDRTANTALAWRYPTRIPAAQTIRSPPMPGRAIAASADSDAGARTALTVCSRNDSADAGPVPSVTIGAVPESDKSWLKPVAAIPPSTTGAVTLPQPGRPSIPEMGGTGGDIAGGRAEPAAAATPAAPSPPAYITVAFAAATPNSE